MISYEEAYRSVLGAAGDFGSEQVSLNAAHGLILAEDIRADRDFPPFDRATKDGIAIAHEAYENGVRSFEIEGIAAAGSPRQILQGRKNCIEVMTGAMLPENTDTVVMYEHINIDKGTAFLERAVSSGQNIHKKGSDEPKNALVLKKGTKIEAAEIGVLASVGKAQVLVKKLPKITVVSTGNELVNVDEKPLPHQIRKSNGYSLDAVLRVEGIKCNLLHINDFEEEIKKELAAALRENNVLLLSGGVSKGKYDYLPKILQELGVDKEFHRVAQRPGKPFWFGAKADGRATVFAFPGNPASTFASYHVYFLPWLRRSLGLPLTEHSVVLGEAFENATGLTRFIRAEAHLKGGRLKATLVMGNGSGDLTSLALSNGFVRFNPETNYNEGDLVPFYPTKRILQ
ncbi:molybdopterin molybdotransferase MoeA [Allomuricauda sp. SCSIO 65647]|uniref:molybdopterin molybdotransferase MoeA n=1 Tax=Allomuricauda sp. SCSIO 65647 TaxID=2908843 RepID=UPI001F3326BC|nr:molybdopterin molybdotransferase MoeA [Muricauda sp. SCSIO 65647]UJH67312.1 molybdopterin molybdotransferase MoeA [Muricauda sp. SCSIO 65647]